MKKNIYFLCVFMAAILISGCTHLSFNNTYKNTYVEPVTKTSQIKLARVAILPFADYSFQQESVQPFLWGLNRKLIEGITDEFVKRGIMVAIQEDTEGLLVSEGIINAFEPGELSATLADMQNRLEEERQIEEVSYISPERELDRSDHSTEMIGEVKKVIQQQEAKKNKAMNEKDLILSRILGILSMNPREPLVNGVTASLSREKIISLGEKLEVDAIVRGRIIDAGTVDKTMNSAFSNQGIIPFFIGPFKDFLIGRGEKSRSLGFAEKEKYELGLLDAYSLKPYATGKKASVLQVRMYLQDAKTGDIIWTGRAEATYNPNIFKKNYKSMCDKLVHQVSVSLGEELFRVPETVKDKEIYGNRGIIYSNVRQKKQL